MDILSNQYIRILGLGIFADKEIYDDGYRPF